MQVKSLALRISKTLFPNITAHYRAYHKLIKNRDSYLYTTGWMQSLRTSVPVDRNANPIPWMNYSMIKLMEDRLKDDFVLFEFGSGYSTRFYAGRVKAVTSVEYDETWFQIIKAQMPENVELIFQKRDIDGAYCRVIGSTGNVFDVVVVDGRDRVNCVKQSIPALSPRGVILLDDSQRDRYREAIEIAKAKGFRALDLEGLKATGKELNRTTIFYRDGNCLGI
jgi:hypothetical protein